MELKYPEILVFQRRIQAWKLKMCLLCKKRIYNATAKACVCLSGYIGNGQICRQSRQITILMQIIEVDSIKLYHLILNHYKILYIII